MTRIAVYAFVAYLAYALLSVFTDLGAMQRLGFALTALIPFWFVDIIATTVWREWRRWE